MAVHSVGFVGGPAESIAGETMTTKEQQHAWNFFRYEMHSCELFITLATFLQSKVLIAVSLLLSLLK